MAQDDEGEDHQTLEDADVHAGLGQGGLGIAVAGDDGAPPQHGHADEKCSGSCEKNQGHRSGQPCVRQDEDRQAGDDVGDGENGNEMECLVEKKPTLHRFFGLKEDLEDVDHEMSGAENERYGPAIDADDEQNQNNVDGDVNVQRRGAQL